MCVRGGVGGVEESFFPKKTFFSLVQLASGVLQSILGSPDLIVSVRRMW